MQGHREQEHHHPRPASIQLQPEKITQLELGIANFLTIYGSSGYGGPSSGAPAVRTFHEYAKSTSYSLTMSLRIW